MAKSRAHTASFRAVLRLFQIFGHPVRVVIFQRLARQPMTAGELTNGLSITRPGVVQHLKIMEDAGLLTAHTVGKRRVYRTEPAGLATLQSWLQWHAVKPKPGPG